MDDMSINLPSAGSSRFRFYGFASRISVPGQGREHPEVRRYLGRHGTKGKQICCARNRFAIQGREDSLFQRPLFQGATMTDTNRAKVAVVTGGMTGIGLAVVRKLVSDGVLVCAGGRRGGDAERQEQFGRDTNGTAVLLPLDVASKDSVTGFVAQVTETLGPPDILVNAAGIFHPARMTDHPDEVWHDTIDINLTGCFNTIRAMMPGMQARGWGRIINIASTAAHLGADGYAAYCASKAGLLGLSRCVSLEGAPHGITCTTLSPTWVETDMMRASIARKAEQTGRNPLDILAEYKSSNPQGQLVQPEDVARLVAFLASDAGRAITMEDIQITAGALW